MINHKRRLACLLLAVCMLLALLIPATAWTEEEDDLYTAFGKENSLTTTQMGYMEQIFEYLTGELDLSTAAACGLMANMYRESRFDPTVGSSSTIGICQWYGTNRTLVINWCEDNGYDPYTLEGQLNYLAHQFRDTNYDNYAGGYYIRIYEYLLGVEDSAQGAYDAAYYFCYYYEIPSNKSTTSTSRGNLAMNVIYPFYESLLALQQSSSEEESTETATDTNALPFRDVSTGDWYYDVVLYAYENNMVSGTSATTFEPNATMTRAQAVQILYNMNGNPTPVTTCPFEDVASGQWYYNAITWAWSAGVVSGTSATTFDPDAVLTREQMVQILYSYYTNYLLESATNLVGLDAYPDANLLSFGTTAMQWAVGNGIISGTDMGTLDPTGSCTRAQGCAMLVRLIQFMEG